MRMKKVSAPELEAVSALPADKRYEYFVKQIVDWRLVWGLRASDGWVLHGDDEGREYLPVWPHAVFAQACARDEWAAAEPAHITLAEWLKGWVEDLARDNCGVNIFPTPTESGVVQHPKDLAAHIKHVYKEEFG